MGLLRPFGSAAVVVKDFVKSRKHEWAEACFIPSASDRAAVERVVRRFLELQGDDLSEGLVFREFADFEPLGRHPKSGMPLTKEFRLFFLDRQPLPIFLPSCSSCCQAEASGAPASGSGVPSTGPSTATGRPRCVMMYRTLRSRTRRTISDARIFSSRMPVSGTVHH